MPIINGTWTNWTIIGSNATIPNPLHVVMTNLPWFGYAIFAITYVILILLFSGMGGKEKYLGIGFLGLILTFVYRSINLVTVAPVAIAAFIMVLTVIIYAVVKEG